MDMTRTRIGRRIAAAAALAGGGFAISASLDAEPANAGDCANDAVSDVSWDSWGGGTQKVIHITPTDAGRYSGDAPWATDLAWSAVQACVPGLEGETADAVYQQIQCHAEAAVFAPWLQNLEVWSVETWRVPTSRDVQYATACNWGGDPYTRD
jgi:hypothetical protein